MFNPIESCNVAIVGGGPAGLSCAISLRQAGIDKVVLLEREDQAGGIPRHCGHSPFGMREFHRVYSGPRYAQKLVEHAISAGVDIRTRTTVVKLNSDGLLDLASPDKIYQLAGQRVLLATGVRETPRAARLVSGARPKGVTTTSALQSMVFLNDQVPFKRPIIVGTELVAFSALLTCHQAGIKPVAMIEYAGGITARAPLVFLPYFFGIPIYYNSHVLKISGRDWVSSLSIVTGTKAVTRELACDGVIFTGRFTPEASLLAGSGIDVDPASGGPEIDQFGRCSDPAYFGAGNLLRPVETAGWSWSEGRQAARWIAEEISSTNQAKKKQISVNFSSPIKFVLPQKINVNQLSDGMNHFQLRFSKKVSGFLKIKQGNKIIWSKWMTAIPERRVLLPIDAIKGITPDWPLSFEFESA